MKKRDENLDKLDGRRVALCLDALVKVEKLSAALDDVFCVVSLIEDHLITRPTLLGQKRLAEKAGPLCTKELLRGRIGCGTMRFEPVVEC